MTDREQVRRDAGQVKHRVLWNSLVQPPPETANHAPDCPRCTLDALLAELEQAERREAALVEALRHIAHFVYDVNSDAEADCHSLKDLAYAALTVYEQSQGKP